MLLTNSPSLSCLNDLIENSSENKERNIFACDSIPLCEKNDKEWIKDPPKIKQSRNCATKKLKKKKMFQHGKNIL